MMNKQQDKNKLSHEVLHQNIFFMNKNLCRKDQSRLNNVFDGVTEGQSVAIFALLLPVS